MTILKVGARGDIHENRAETKYGDQTTTPFTTPGGEKFVVMSIAHYEHLVEAAEDTANIVAADRVMGIWPAARTSAFRR